MPKYQTKFELGLEDIALIEDCLTARTQQLAPNAIDWEAPRPQEKNCDVAQQAREKIKGIRELLGRIHHQKRWYEPEIYVPRG